MFWCDNIEALPAVPDLDGAPLVDALLDPPPPSLLNERLCLLGCVVCLLGCVMCISQEPKGGQCTSIASANDVQGWEVGAGPDNLFKKIGK